MNQRPSVVEAARNADKAERSEHRTRYAASRAVLREAAQRCANLMAGVVVQGVEEIELVDRLELALLEYLKAKENPVTGRAYVGNARGLDQIVAGLDALLTAPQGEEQPASDEQTREAA